MSEPLVRLDLSDGLATITLDQPPVNALDRRLVDELAATVDAVRTNDDVRAVLVTGGETVFAAGGDVKEMLGWNYPTAARRSSALGDACDALARLPIPVVAAIQGYALGGGCELALAADFRVCSTRSRLGFPEILLGVIPGAGGTQRLPRLIGAARAKRLIMTGRAITAEEALACGLVDDVAEPDAVHETAVELVRPFLTGPAVALAAAKQAIDGGFEVDLPTGLQLERSLFNGLFATEDRLTGMGSFLEHGPGKATFRGR
jgi:enoyl-CoA hydratase/carnithine racemase